MRFKIRTFEKLSKTKRARIRKRSTDIALKLEVLHLILNAKTKEEQEHTLSLYIEEYANLHDMITHNHMAKLPRKLKKREKQRACDIFNAYAIIPELLTLILSERDEEKSDKA